MKKHFIYSKYLAVLLLLLLGAPPTIFAQTLRLEGTFTNNANTYSGGIANMAARGVTRFARAQSAVTGTTQRRCLFNGPGLNYSIKWTASNTNDHALNTKLTNGLIYNGSSDYYFTVTGGNYYTLITGTATSGNQDISILETSYNPASITSVSQSPSGNTLAPGSAPTITVTLGNTPNAAEYVYVRYSTNSFSTSSIVQVTGFGAGTSGTASIPAQSNGATVQYYVFTSNMNSTTMASLLADADYYTLNMYTSTGQNNTGANNSYVIGSTWTTAQAGNWSSGSTWVGGVAPTNTSNIGSVVIAHAVTMDVVPNLTNLTLNANLTMGANLTIPSGGTLTISSTRTLFIGSNLLTISGSLSNSGTIRGGTTSDLTIDGSTADISIPRVNKGLRDLTLNRANSIYTLPSSDSVNRNMTISAGTLVASGTCNLWFTGAGTFTNNSVVKGNNGTGNDLRVRFAGNTAIAGTATFANFLLFDVVVESSGTVKAASSGTANIGLQFGTLQVLSSGTLDFSTAFSGGGRVNVTINSGTVSVQNANTCNLSSLTINSGTTFRSSGSTAVNIGITGDFANNGTLTTTNGSSTLNITFNGSALQTISGSSTSAYNNLTINNSLGANTRAVALSTSINIGGNLALTSGRLDLNGSNNIALTGTLTESNGNTVYNSGSPSTGNGYISASGTINAATLNVGGLGAILTTSDNLGVVTVQRFHNARTLTTGNGISRYYSIVSANAGNATLTQSYDLGELNGVVEGTNMGVYVSSTAGGLYSLDNATSFNTSSYPRTIANAVSYALSSAAKFFTTGNLPSSYQTIANGDLNTASTWQLGTVPPATASVVIANAVTISATNLTYQNVTINSGASLTISASRTLTIGSGGAIINNSSTASLGSGTVTATGALTVAGTSATTFTTLNLNGATTLTTVPTISGTLVINSGSSLAVSPNYSSGSTLQYSTGAAFTRGGEWLTGSGTTAPFHVVVTGTGTALTLDNGNSQNLTTRGNLTIESGASLSFGTVTNKLSVTGNLINNGGLSLSTAGGGDIYLAGNWTRGTTGTFTHNSRALFLYGSGDQTITLTGGGTETFGYLIESKSTGNLLLGTLTNLAISGSVGNTLSLSGSATVDLGGNTLTMSGTGGSISLGAGVHTIQNGSFVNTTGFKTVSGTGTLSFASNCLLILNHGMNFNSLGELNGTMRIASGGYIFSSAPTYNNGSILEYANGSTFDRGNEWQSTYTPTVLVSSGTTLRMGSGTTAANAKSITLTGAGSGLTMQNASGSGMTVSLQVSGDINLGDGTTLTLSPSSGGDLGITGNWTRSSTATFVHNSRAVNFRGTSDQTITVTGGGTETFGYLLEGKTTGNLLAGTNTDIGVAASSGNVLQFNGSAILDLNGRTLQLTGTGGSIFVAAGTHTISNGTINNLNGFKTVSGTGTLSLASNTVTLLNAGMNFNSLGQLYGTLRIGAGGFIFSSAPNYNTGSVLEYANGSTFDRGNEWQDTYTPNVLVSGGTTLRMGSGSTAANATAITLTGAGSGLTMQNSTGTGMTAALVVSGDINIGSGTNLTLSPSAGGDISLLGNWIRNSSGTFTHNSRAVNFRGSANQTITVTGGGTEVFGFLIENKTAGTVSPDANTNLEVAANSGSGLQLLGSGVLDLNGKKLTLSGTGGSINVAAGTHSIQNGTLNNTNGFKSVTGTGTLNLEASLLTLLNAGMNFNNQGQLFGTLRLSTGGFVFSSAPNYNTGSLLEYAFGTAFDRGQEWQSTYNPNVLISGGTTLRMGSGSSNANARTITLTDAGSGLTMQDGLGTGMTGLLVVNSDLTIGTGTSVILSPASGGDLSLKANLINNGTLNNNNRSVTFSGTGNQTVTGSSSSVFKYIDINKSSGAFNLSGSMELGGSGGVGELRISNGIFNFNGNSISVSLGSVGLLRGIGGTMYLNGNELSAFARFSNSTTYSDQANKRAVATKLIVLSASSLPGITFGKLIVNSGGNVSLLGNAGSSDSLLIASGGTLNFGSSSFTFTAQGPVQIDGTVTQNSSSTSGQLVMGGTSSQVLNTTVSIPKLTVSNASGVTLVRSTTITDKLTFGSGLLITGSNSLNLGASATIVESFGAIDSYVAGNLATTRNVGTASESFGGLGLVLGSGASSAGSVTVTRTTGTEPLAQNGVFTKAITRTWDVYSSGTAANRTLTFGWPSANDNAVNTAKVQAFGSTDGGNNWSSASGIVNAATEAIAPQERSLISNSIGSVDGIYTITEQSLPSLNITTSGSYGGYYGNVTIATGLNVTLSSDLDVAGNMSVPAGTTLNLGTRKVTGNGTFQLDSGATLQIAHTEGIDSTGTTGAIRTTQIQLSTGASYVYNGSSLQNTGNGLPTNHVRNLTINNSAGVNLGNHIKISNVLTISAGNFNVNGKTLTLQSTSAGTGKLAQMGTGASLTGNITMEQYINGSAGHYFLGTPIKNQTLSDWTGSFPMAGFSGAPASGNLNTFFYNEAASSALAGWSGPTSITDSITGRRAARVYLRSTFFVGTPKFANTGLPVIGDGLDNIAGANESYQFDPAFSVTGYDGGGWNLMANPFPCTIDWGSASGWNDRITEGVDATIYAWDKATRQYVTYNFSTGIGVPSTFTGLISSSQGFFIKANKVCAKLSATEAVKTTSNTSFRRNGSVQNLLRIQLGHNGIYDNAAIHFAFGATRYFDNAYDAWKIYSSNVSLAVAVKEVPKAMSVHVQDAIGSHLQDTIDLIAYSDPGAQSLNFSGLASFASGVSIYLLDRYTGTVTNVLTSPNYNFNVVADTNSQGRRFSLVFGNLVTATVPVLKTGLHLYPNPATTGNVVSLQLKGNTGTAMVKYLITDLTGKTIISQSVVVDGTDPVMIETPASAGLYLLHYEAGNCKGTEKLTIK